MRNVERLLLLFRPRRGDRGSSVSREEARSTFVVGGLERKEVVSGCNRILVRSRN